MLTWLAWLWLWDGAPPLVIPVKVDAICSVPVIAVAAVTALSSVHIGSIAPENLTC